eukprot:gene13423-biopygen111
MLDWTAVWQHAVDRTGVGVWTARAVPRDGRYTFNNQLRTGSQMPRHLISDAHEWMNEIPTVPIYYLAKPQPGERAWQNQRGKKTLSGASEIPLPLSSLYLFNEAELGLTAHLLVLRSHAG